MQTAKVLIDGEPVYIEMERSLGEEHTSGGTVEKIENSFEQAKQTIISLSTSMVQAIKDVDAALTPNEFTLEFGVKFKMDGTVVVAAVSSEATLTVKMVYQHK
jgi:hypothetical protein